ncbi:MAG: hypothetical protein MI919_27415 [Holophagales bacterium]|nr:hypothetical protein [Holophagales bacterium]
MLAGRVARADEAEDAFRRGVVAADQERWAEVIEAMAEAVAHRPQPSASWVRIYGTRMVRYTPHAYLGIAHAALGDCHAALDSLRAVRRDLLAEDRLELVDRHAEQCRSRLASEPSSGARAAASSGVETPARDAPAELGPEIAAVPTPDPPPYLRRAAADYLAGLYAEVVATLDSSLRDPPAGDADWPGHRATAFLLAGASRFALAKVASEESGPMLEAARADLLAYRGLRPDHRPSPYWFSPAFLAFFDDFPQAPATPPGAPPQNR